jgi:geranylgeranylglycerol-phosphate geranylgeranyltransferase
MKPYLQLIRPVNFIITGISIYVSCLLAGGTLQQFLPMFFASLAGACIAAGGMVINDIFDIEIDRINKPNRPLPSGAIGLFDALMFYAALSGAGIVMSAYTTTPAVIIAFAAIPIIFFYSYKFKSTPLFGNIIVGGLTGLAFIFGGAVVGNVKLAFMPALFAFLINVGREIIKDMEDVEGDSKYKIVTFPIRYGIKKSAMAATFFLLAVIGTTFVPYLQGLYGIKFLISVNLGVNAVIVFVLFSLWKDQSSKNLNSISNILKWDMFVGLLAIYLG